MSLAWFGRLIAFFVLLLAATPASAQVVRMEQRGKAVAGVSADGEALWKIQHNFGEEEHAIASLRFEPLIDERRAYYAIRSDLITVDLDAGKVLERRRFPGFINAMVPDEDNYRLTLLARSDEADSGIDVRYKPGDPAPGVGLFESALVMTTNLDALAVARNHTAPTGLSLSQISTGIVQLTAEEKRDPTNLFLPLHLGRYLKLLKQSAPATQAFERALRVTNTPWSDDIFAAGLLASEDEDVVAEQFFERGQKKMLARGIRPDHLNGMVLQVMLTRFMGSAVGEAIEREDVERADRLLGHIATLFPATESSALVWQHMGDWMDAHNRPDLAEHWHVRATEARNSPMASLNHKNRHQIDLLYVFILALFIALFLIPMAIGLRPVRQRFEKGLPRPDINIWDAVGILAMFALLWVLPQLAQNRVEMTWSISDAPQEVDNQAYASPKFVDWLEGMRDSEARSVWLLHAQKAQEALQEGSLLEDTPPSEKLLADIILAGPDRPKGKSTLDEALLINVLADLIPTDSRLTKKEPVVDEVMRLRQANNPFQEMDSLTIRFGFMMLSILGLLLGMLARAFMPPLAYFLRILIPGGARMTGFLAGPICIFFFAASLSLCFNLDLVLSMEGLTDYADHFGFEGLQSALPTQSWAWIALAASLVIHVTTTGWEQRNNSKRHQTS